MEKILLIEDESPLSNNLKILLEEEGYKVYQAANGIDGIKLAHEEIPDLIISDIMMPGLDGYQVLEIFNSDRIISGIPFIFLSAKAEMENFRAGMQLGADDYLTKPIKAPELLQAVKVRLKKHKALLAKAQKQHDKSSIPEKDSSEAVMLKVNDKIELVSKKNIICIEALGESSKVYLKNGQKIIVSKLLKLWQSVLPENEFIRIHRSTLININFIEKFEPWFQRSLKVYLKNTDMAFIVSKRYASKLKDIFSL
ncbi:MAG: response regulator [Bacteroidota bacterium]|nr:response regulator [Bacteroidota bacterium]MDP4192165.1 response regulator [Bacteroidota bacterium]MDP4196735.1 response regulator [Bacteroidota bacterium]